MQKVDYNFQTLRYDVLLILYENHSWLCLLNFDKKMKVMAFNIVTFWAISLSSQPRFKIFARMEDNLMNYDSVVKPRAKESHRRLIPPVWAIFVVKTSGLSKTFNMIFFCWWLYKTLTKFSSSRANIWTLGWDNLQKLEHYGRI